MAIPFAGSYPHLTSTPLYTSSISPPQSRGNPYISGRIPPGTPVCRIDAILVKIRYFFWECFLELRLDIKVFVSLPFVSPTATKRNMERISEFAAALVACESTNRAQKRQLLTTFQRSQISQGTFIYLSTATLQKFINQTDPQQAEHMKGKFKKECSYIALVESKLMPFRNLLHRQQGANNTTESSIQRRDRGGNRSSSPEVSEPDHIHQNALSFERPSRSMPLADELDAIPLGSLSSVQQQRGAEIDAMGPLVPDDFILPGDSTGDKQPLKDKYQCTVMQNGVPMGTPSFHTIPVRFDRSGFQVIPGVEGRQDLLTVQRVLESDHSQCPLCREPLTPDNIIIDTALQKKIAEELATAINGMSDEQIIFQLRKLETEFSINAEGIRVSKRHVQEKVVELIKNLPDQFQGKPLFARIVALYQAHVA